MLAAQLLPRFWGPTLDVQDRDALWLLQRRVVNELKPPEDEMHRLLLGIWNAASPENRPEVIHPKGRNYP